MVKIPHDVLGNIAILKFPKEMKIAEKREIAKGFLKENKKVETVLEKTGRIKGRLRKAELKFLVGKNVRVAEYVENKCKFRFNVDETYFSPRLAEQRKQVAEELVRILKRCNRSQIRNNRNPAHLSLDSESGNSKARLREVKPKILVMFAGVAPWSVVIAKKLKEAGKQVEIISNEINRNANKYAGENIRINHVGDYVEVVGGDAKKLPEKLKEKFDFILMPRPQLDETFLKTALKLSKKGTVIYYHGFGRDEDVLEEIKKDVGKKIGKIVMSKAGEIAPYKYRWLAKFRVR